MVNCVGQRDGRGVQGVVIRAEAGFPRCSQKTRASRPIVDGPHQSSEHPFRELLLEHGGCSVLDVMGLIADHKWRYQLREAGHLTSRPA